MLTKPDLPDASLLACLRDDYGLRISEIAFLPIGADVNTAVYRAVAGDGSAYFLKLRSGAFDDLAVEIPHFLSAHAATRAARSEARSEAIIAPLETRARRLWTRVDRFAAVLFPFVAGQNGYQVPLADPQIVALGADLKSIHTAVLPVALERRIPRERFAPQWRERVRAFQAQVEQVVYPDPIAAELAAFLRAQRAVVADLVGRAERLAAELQAQPLPYVLCHGDLHAGNLLIVEDGPAYIVDWDTLVMAPKEHDLMFFSSAGGSAWPGPREQALFCQGYGEMAVDRQAIAYYRCERIVQDIAAYCEQLLATTEGGEDRAQGLRQLVSQFLPGQVIDIAVHSAG